MPSTRPHSARAITTVAICATVLLTPWSAAGAGLLIGSIGDEARRAAAVDVFDRVLNFAEYLGTPPLNVETQSR
jgi:hypothetical protein